MANTLAMPTAGELETRFRTLESRRLGGGWKPRVWALCAWIGGRFLRREPPDLRTPSGRALLNLGCGSRHHEGWVNADFYRLQHLLMNRARRPDWMLDLTEPFACPADRWDGVFLEHVNEHLTYAQNMALMREVLRTLCPGGRVRLVVPSLHRYLDWRRLRAQEPKMARYGSLPEAISNLTQNHAHRSVWDPGLMTEMLESMGFEEVAERSFGQSADPELARDAEGHRWESFYVEARKPA